MMRSFTWNRFPIKIFDWFLAYFTCGLKLLEVYQQVKKQNFLTFKDLTLYILCLGQTSAAEPLI